MQFSSLLFASLLVTGISAYPTGAPSGACSDLRPHHSGPSGLLPPQNSTSPFSISVNTQSYESDEFIIVTLTGTQSFRGFILEAVSKIDGKTPVGTFQVSKIPAEAQAGPCGTDTVKTSVTHIDANPKNNMKFVWQAPPVSDFSQTIYFQGAFAVDHDTFWADVVSPDVTFMQGTPGTTTPSASSCLAALPLITFLAVAAPALL